MAHSSADSERDTRITTEIVVDAYGPEEQAMGWYYYLQGHLAFPFTARCIVQRSISPLDVGDEVQVVEMAAEDECLHEMFVAVRLRRRLLAVPLAQLEGMRVDVATAQAIGDWHYGMRQGYQL